MDAASCACSDRARTKPEIKNAVLFIVLLLIKNIYDSALMKDGLITESSAGITVRLIRALVNMVRAISIPKSTRILN
jgi:hypothetical protein